MRYFLGLDGGGTKTEALILDAGGAECGRGLGGPGNIANNDAETLARSVREAVQAACQAAHLSPTETRFAAVCAGVAGYSAETRRASFIENLRAAVPVEEPPVNLEAAYRLEPDYTIAYWGATEGEPGIVVIAGTGAVVYGCNAEGQTHREDGLGYLLGDRGSGFNLGLRALRYTLERMREGKRDALTDAVLDFTGARSQNEIVHWLYSGFSPARVAALAPVVGALAEAGDPAARDQVAEMAHRLRHSVWLTRHKLWLPRDTPVYPLGGLWQLGDFFLSEFTAPRSRSDNSAGNDNPGWLEARVNLAAPKHASVFGAALLARSGSL
jgi:N-acetylglucosamine kinase-like BadF-type ATPase